MFINCLDTLEKKDENPILGNDFVTCLKCLLIQLISNEVHELRRKIKIQSETMKK